MRRRASAYDAVTDVIAPPCSRAAASARGEQLDLAPLLDRLGQRRRRRRSGWRRRGARARPCCVPPPPPRAAPAAASAAAQQAFGREVGGVREAGRVAAHDAQPGAAVAARRRAPRRGRRRSGRSTSADPRRTPRRSRRRRAARGRAWPAARRVRSAGSLMCASMHPSDRWPVAEHARVDAGLPIVSAMALASGLTASVTLEGRRWRHRARARQRRRARARHAPARRAGRAGERAGHRRQARTRRTHDRRLPGAARAPHAHSGRPEVTAEATLEEVEGRRLTFRVSVTDARGLVAAGPHHPGRRRAATASSNGRRSRADDRPSRRSSSSAHDGTRRSR